ncbi:MAG TPA: NAD-dependent epimerase/dehydratase family protein [Mycobacteriales bacterium]|nr:NAD-dependent epimerase/dehydratase family protein [Mycobacteriales bacterium]
MAERYLVTGGAGFVGSHIVGALRAEGHDVVVIDSRCRPGETETVELLEGVEYVWADLNDDLEVRRALRDVDVVVHQAAMVGVGQSMFEIDRYVGANVGGTASLLQAVVETGHVRKIVMASSMSVYGEGLYHCTECGNVRPDHRSEDRLAARRWEQSCPRCGRDVVPVPITEEEFLQPTSVYGASKRSQEELCLVVGRAYGIPTTCFRYFGIYGDGQLLTNPYTGIVSMFAARLVNGKPPLVFEDGQQLRDLVHVDDVCTAVLAACEHPTLSGSFNLASGDPVTVEQVARILAQEVAPDIAPEISSRYRKGDIRHCYGDPGRFAAEVGWKATVPLEDGLRGTARWASEHRQPEAIDQMRAELASRSLLI